MEDVICLVFLEQYFNAFVAKHTDEKVTDILQKTWQKMSGKGQVTTLRLSLSKHAYSLIQQALYE